MPAFILWANPSQVLPEGSVKGLYGVIKTEPSQKHIGGCRMKTVQRERRYVCGQTKQNAVYQEIEIYTVGTDQKSRQREKQKVTPVPFRGKNPEHWDGHNAKRARKWFIRLLNTNFTEADTHTSLTYSDEFLPKTEEEADRDISNFLRRLRTKCKARGLPAPEAITVTEHQDADPDTGQKAVRFHHHVILKCQLTRDEIEGCWVRKKKRMGTTNADRLQMDKSSLEALANYLMKYPKRKHRWRRTRGIRDPILPTPNDSKYTRRGIERIAKDPTKLHSPEFWEKKYPGWKLKEAQAEYNDYWGWSISLKMHRIPERRGRPCGS
jgi:hypothetical protein|nr:MAG TPA: Replication associated protein [Caudoviricetes sp.]